jgi:hypothetical protein
MVACQILWGFNCGSLLSDPWPGRLNLADHTGAAFDR